VAYILSKPFFSIVVVSLDAEATIKKTIESIINQSFTNYEIIIKDGCSKNNIINEIPESDRIKIFVKPDKSIYEAMNQAIELSSGDYICFMNCGDKYPNNTILQTIFDTASKTNKCCNVIYSDYQRNDVIVRMPKSLYDFYLYRTPLNHQSMYIRKEVFKKYGLYDLDYKILADYDHTLRTYRQGVRYIYCNCVACDYLGGGLSESKQGLILKQEEYKKITEKYFGKLQLLKYRIIILLSLKKMRGRIATGKSPKFIRKIYYGIVNKLNQL